MQRHNRKHSTIGNTDKFILKNIPMDVKEAWVLEYISKIQKGVGSLTIKRYKEIVNKYPDYFPNSPYLNK